MNLFILCACVCVRIYSRNTKSLITINLGSNECMCAGVCDKVLLRFTDRWWPRVNGGIFRHYRDRNETRGANQDGDSDSREEHIEGKREAATSDIFSKIMSTTYDFVEWLDLTEGINAPVLMGFICGEKGIEKYCTGKSDFEVAVEAVKCAQEYFLAVSHQDCT